MKEDYKKDYPPDELYDLEEKHQLIDRKEDLVSRMQNISENLSKKNNINEFLKQANKDDEFSNEQFLKAEKMGKRGVFLSIKFLAVLFFSSHLISIFIINDIINAIEEEIIASAKSYLRQKDRDPNDDFYQNFKKLTYLMPNYSMFFISSFLADTLYETLGYINLSIIINIIVLLILIFVFREFEFNIDRIKYKNYNINEFIYLFIIYAILCLCQGLIALVPLKIIQKQFKFYDRFNEYLKRKNNEYGNNSLNNSINVLIKNNENNNNNINNNNENNKNNNNENNKNNNNENNEKNNQNSPVNENRAANETGEGNEGNNEDNESNNHEENKKFIYKLNGYLLFFLCSISLSIIIKTILNNTVFDDYNYKTRKNVNFYFIIIYLIFSLITIFYYGLYSYFCIWDRKKEKEKKSEFATELFGYAIYSETINNNTKICCCDSCGCCVDCKICCETLNLSLCCYACSCKYCSRFIFCCDCCKRNYNKSYIYDEYDTYPIRPINYINREKTVCILYKITGFWNWLGTILTNRYIYIFVIFILLSHVTNMGFEDKIWDNDDSNNINNKNLYWINGIIILCYFLFYIITYYGGRLLYKHSGGETKKGYDAVMFLIGLPSFFIIHTLISTIFSGLAYFCDLGKSEKYLLAIPKGGLEYIKIHFLEYFLLWIDMLTKNLVFFSSSTIMSFYLLFWDFFMFIINIINLSSKTLILIQFIIGCALSVFFIPTFILGIIEFKD